MKNHELLDLIGDVSEDYVQAADGKVIRPKFRWKAVAACAACAALVLGAYPAYQAAHPPLHEYTVLEGGASTTEDNTVKVPAGGEIDVPGQDTPAPDPSPDDPPRGDGPDPIQIGDGERYDVPAISQDEAIGQYQRLLQWMGGVDGREPAAYPEWFAGMWLDNDWPDNVSRLTVALVNSFRTEELEAEIRARAFGGTDVLFCGAKYPYSRLYGLMDPVTATLDGTGLSCGIGVDVTANCLGVDLYSNGEAVPDSVLAKLAKLDPEGDAIRVRLFTGKVDTLTDDAAKDPAPEPVEPDAKATPAVTQDNEPTATPVDGSGPVYHGEDAPADAIPGGVSPVGELPQAKGEDIQPARHDLLPPGE